jgi:hypothetical protein
VGLRQKEIPKLLLSFWLINRINRKKHRGTGRRTCKPGQASKIGDKSVRKVYERSSVLRSFNLFRKSNPAGPTDGQDASTNDCIEGQEEVVSSRQSSSNWLINRVG